MNTHADKTQKNKMQSIASETSQKQSGGESTFQIVDSRTEAVAQRKLQEMANNSSKILQLRAFQEMADNYTRQQHPIKNLGHTGWQESSNAGLNVGDSVLQPKWDWWKNRRSGAMTFYDNKTYSQLHVSWDTSNIDKVHVTYDHSDGTKSFYYPYTHSYTYDHTDERAHVKVWLKDAWDDFRDEFNAR